MAWSTTEDSTVLRPVGAAAPAAVHKRLWKQINLLKPTSRASMLSFGDPCSF